MGEFSMIERSRRWMRFKLDGHIRYIKSTWDAIERGENINVKGEGGNTAVHIACRDVFNSSFLGILLVFEPDLNIQNDLLQTPLHVHLNNLCFRINILELLLENGADPNIVDAGGNTSLHYMMGHPSTRIYDAELLTRTFLKFNAKVNIQNKKGDTPLHLAVHRGNVGCITALLHTEASVLIKNNQNETAMDLAYRNRYYEPKVFIKMAEFAIILNNCRIPVNRLFLDEIHSNERLRVFNEQCKGEISVLSNIKVGDTNVTLNVILKSSTDALARYLRNDEILEWLQNFEFGQYKIFGKRLNQHFKDGLARKEAEDLGFIFFTESFPNLPELCVCGIISYMKNEDLKQFEI